MMAKSAITIPGGSLADQFHAIAAARRRGAQPARQRAHLIRRSRQLSARRPRCVDPQERCIAAPCRFGEEASPQAGAGLINAIFFPACFSSRSRGRQGRSAWIARRAAHIQRSLCPGFMNYLGAGSKMFDGRFGRPRRARSATRELDLSPDLGSPISIPCATRELMCDLAAGESGAATLPDATRASWTTLSGRRSRRRSIATSAFRRPSPNQSYSLSRPSRRYGTRISSFLPYHAGRVHGITQHEKSPKNKGLLLYFVRGTNLFFTLEVHRISSGPLD